MKLYAAEIRVTGGRKRDSTVWFVTADNPEEALGKADKHSYRLFPTSSGWTTRYIKVHEVPPGLIQQVAKSPLQQ